ncbi:MAG: NAD(P)-dependent oxidoreductase, partial [Roseiarcus sp.]
MRIFFFGVGYCAWRLIQREPWIEASGTARTTEAVAALRRQGVDAYPFDGASADPGLERALDKAEAIVVSIPPRDRAGATLERFAAAIAVAPALRRV